MRITEQLSWLFNLFTMEGDIRILMGLFYQLVSAQEGDKEKEMETGTERMCTHVCVSARAFVFESDRSDASI